MFLGGFLDICLELKHEMRDAKDPLIEVGGGRSLKNEIAIVCGFDTKTVFVLG